MKITIFGTGYVGLVTGACLAEMGNKVVCVDVDSVKIDHLRKGEVPFFEPGLSSLVKHNEALGNIEFTTNAQYGVEHGQIIFIAVGTPPEEDGSADLQYVLEVARTIGGFMNGYKVIADKSTVPVGTADKVTEAIQQELACRDESFEFDVVSNPEFLKEGAAVQDFMKPDRIIIGSRSSRAIELMSQLYAPFNRNSDRVMVMDARSAELTKYAANAMLATKISFMNELSNIADRVGADIELVRQGIGSDPRIGYQFIYPGCGYGGSCFPKDVRALHHTANAMGYVPRILQAVHEVNEQQKYVLVHKIRDHFQDQLQGKTLAIWGLAFKPNTDDVREAPSRVILEALWEHGARTKVYDPEAMDEIRKLYGDRESLVFCESAEEAVKEADGLVLVTEWNMFRSPDFDSLRKLLREPVIFDGRNQYTPSVVRAAGLKYYGIGRP